MLFYRKNLTGGDIGLLITQSLIKRHLIRCKETLVEFFSFINRMNIEPPDAMGTTASKTKVKAVRERKNLYRFSESKILHCHLLDINYETKIINNNFFVLFFSLLYLITIRFNLIKT